MEVEEYGDNLLPYLFEIDDEINANSEQLTLKSIDNAQLVLSFIDLRLRNIRNSKLTINKLIPDILYNIFTLVVYTSRYPVWEIMNVSRVCRHWREFALGRPALWAFLDIGRPPEFFELFEKRSQNAPLILLWENGMDDPIFENAPSKSYLMSNAHSILSRTHSLTIKTSYNRFPGLHRDLFNSALPFQLRHLNICLYRDYYYRANFNEGQNVNPILPSMTHALDDSFLRDVEITGLNLPWLQLSHNKLTSLKLTRLMNPPPLSHLLVFLSNCPSLKVLEINLGDFDEYGTKLIYDTRPSINPQSKANELDFPDLTQMELQAWGPSSYSFIQHLSRYIRTLRSLSQFKLFFRTRIYQSSDTPKTDTSSDIEEEEEDDDDQGTPSISSLQVLEAIPSETLSNFSKFRYLDISYSDSPGRLKIYGYMSPSDCPEEVFEICPLAIECQGFEEFDYSFILELGHFMPRVRHLKLRDAAWVLLSLENVKVNFHRVFPNLHILEFTNCVTDALKSIPPDVRLKKLILESCRLSYKVLADVTLKTGAKVLRLAGMTSDIDYTYGHYYHDVLPALRAKGVVITN